MLLGRPPNPTKSSRVSTRRPSGWCATLEERSTEPWDAADLADVCHTVIERDRP
ncbi:MAG TPA: hypothetical protein VIL20_30935 [Sandaracinaceae bacterium]